jgi:UDP-3-O-[3-hydroxymyristoyl] glucosamine N-acyltransferase
VRRVTPHGLIDDEKLGVPDRLIILNPPTAEWARTKFLPFSLKILKPRIELPSSIAISGRSVGQPLHLGHSVRQEDRKGRHFALQLGMEFSGSRKPMSLTDSPVSFTAAKIAEHLRGEVVGDGSTRLTGFAPANTAKVGDLTFAEKRTYFAAAEQSAASAILVSGEFESANKVLIRVPNARIAMARVLPLFFPLEKPGQGIHPSAIIDPSARVHQTAYVGPYCVIKAGAKIGERSVLMGGNHIGRDCEIGDDACFYQNVVLYAESRIGHRVTIHAGSVIGSDGYGYVLDEGRHRKLLQTGNVIIHDDVEIGANTTIDRATFGSTIVGQGTKIDNLVQIAHNVVIGQNCLIMAQVGIAGSARLGNYCVITGQVGIHDHSKIGNQAMVGAQAGVLRDIPDGGKVWGTPAFPEKEILRQIVAVTQLPELIRRVRELEKQLGQLSTPNT